MKRLFEGYRRVQPVLNRVLWVCVLMVGVIRFWLNDMPPLLGWEHAHDVGELVEGFSLSYIASYFFFFVGDIWHRQDRHNTMIESVRLISRLAVMDFEQFIAHEGIPQTEPQFHDPIVFKESKEELVRRFDAQLTLIVTRKGAEVEEKAVKNLVKAMRARHISMMLNSEVINLEGLIKLQDISDHFEKNIPTLQGGHADIIVEGITLWNAFHQGWEQLVRRDLVGLTKEQRKQARGFRKFQKERIKREKKEKAN